MNDKQTNKQTNEQTNKQTNKWTHPNTHNYAHIQGYTLSTGTQLLYAWYKCARLHKDDKYFAEISTTKCFIVVQLLHC